MNYTRNSIITEIEAASRVLSSTIENIEKANNDIRQVKNMLNDAKKRLIYFEKKRESVEKELSELAYKLDQIDSSI